MQALVLALVVVFVVVAAAAATKQARHVSAEVLMEAAKDATALGRQTRHGELMRGREFELLVLWRVPSHILYAVDVVPVLPLALAPIPQKSRARAHHLSVK